MQYRQRDRWPVAATNLRSHDLRARDRRDHEARGDDGRGRPGDPAEVGDPAVVRIGQPRIAGALARSLRRFVMVLPLRKTPSHCRDMVRVFVAIVIDRRSGLTGAAAASGPDLLVNVSAQRTDDLLHLAAAKLEQDRHGDGHDPSNDGAGDHERSAVRSVGVHDTYRKARSGSPFRLRRNELDPPGLRSLLRAREAARRARRSYACLARVQASGTTSFSCRSARPQGLLRRSSIIWRRDGS